MAKLALTDKSGINPPAPLFPFSCLLAISAIVLPIPLTWLLLNLFPHKCSGHVCGHAMIMVLVIYLLPGIAGIYYALREIKGYANVSWGSYISIVIIVGVVSLLLICG